MKNTHIEHPEDCVLSGDLSVLDWFTADDSTISTKIDGSPAIVWGTNPSTGNFFVGTKSVFNKKLIKINESHDDIDRNHSGKVATILHKCFVYLPRIDGIFQGDFIGFGGDNVYQPNTIAYVFDEIVQEQIIITPHTYYEADDDLRNAVVKPYNFDNWMDKGTTDCKFFVEWVDLKERKDLTDRCNFARQIATICVYPESNRQIARIKKQLNRCFKEKVHLDDLTLEAIAFDNDCDVNLLRLWKLVHSIKMDLFDYIIDLDINNTECYIHGEQVWHEGYVMYNEFGTYKLIDRLVFSSANFNTVRT
jgi:hypothetical protein